MSEETLSGHHIIKEQISNRHIGSPQNFEGFTSIKNRSHNGPPFKQSHHDQAHDENTETTHHNIEGNSKYNTLALGITQMIVGAAGTVLTSPGSNEAVQVLLTGLEEGLKIALDEGQYF